MKESRKSDIEAFKTIYEALEPLEEDARNRVLTSIATMFGIDGKVAISPPPPDIDEGTDGVEDVVEHSDNVNEYNEFAELYADTDPNSGAEKALVAGYWLQVCQGADNFSGFSVNSELNNLGHKLSNVTVSLSGLIKSKPQLVLQLKKTGKSQQARKTYKLSKAGVDRVKDLIRAK
jgi:hypothetical protein